jgi:hypothetical protein
MRGKVFTFPNEGLPEYRPDASAMASRRLPSSVSGKVSLLRVAEHQGARVRGLLRETLHVRSVMCLAHGSSQWDRTCDFACGIRATRPQT